MRKSSLSGRKQPCNVFHYDSIFIPEEASNVYPKGAITKRNQWLIDNSDLLIAYVRREKGGAATCLKMAEKAKIEVVKI